MIDASTSASLVATGVAARAPDGPINVTGSWEWLDFVPTAGSFYHAAQFGGCVWGAITE